MTVLLTFDLDDVQQRRAVRAAARTLGFPIVHRDGPARFAVQLAAAEDGYRLGLETMKRWRAALGRDLALDQPRGRRTPDTRDVG